MKAFTENSNTIILYDGNVAKGKLTYANLFSAKATFVDDENKHYEIKPVNFLKLKFEIRLAEKVVISIKRKWMGVMVVQTHFSATVVDYVFKRRRIFSRTYVLTDKDDRELARLKTVFRWKQFKRDYQIEVSDSLKRQNQWLVIVSSITYLMRIINRRRSSHAG